MHPRPRQARTLFMIHVYVLVPGRIGHDRTLWFFDLVLELTPSNSRTSHQIFPTHVNKFIPLHYAFHSFDIPSLDPPPRTLHIRPQHLHNRDPLLRHFPRRLLSNLQHNLLPPHPIRSFYSRAQPFPCPTTTSPHQWHLQHRPHIRHVSPAHRKRLRRLSLPRRVLSAVVCSATTSPRPGNLLWWRIHQRGCGECYDDPAVRLPGA